MQAQELVFPASPLAAFGGLSGGGAGAFVLDDDTQLRIVSVNSVAGVVLGVQGVRLDETGEPKTIQETHTPLTTRTTKTQDYNIGKGVLLRLTVFVSSGTPLIGQTYVMAQIVQGQGAARVVIGTVLAGLVTAVQAVGFPGSPIRSSLEVEPCVRLIVGSTPAGGAEISELVPTGARWELLAFSTKFTEGAGLNATPKLVFDDGGSNEYGSVDGIVSIATNHLTYSWLAGLGWELNAQNGLRLCVGLPSGFRLLAGHRIRTVTTNMNALDSYTAPVYTVREWMECS